MKQGTRKVGQFLCLDYKRASVFSFGITASGKYGNAPARNRFKRLVREAIRLSYPLLPKSISIHVVPRQRAKDAKMGDIQSEIMHLLPHETQ